MMIARSDGLIAADVRPLVRMSVQVIAEQNGRREQGSAGGGGRSDYNLFHRCRTGGFRRARAVAAGPDQPGIAAGARRRHDRGAGARLAGDIAAARPSATAWRGDFNRKGSSAFSGCIGQALPPRASPWWTMARCPGGAASLNMDDEGQSHPVHHADRGRHPARLHPGQPECTPDVGVAGDRQRPARVLWRIP